MFTKWSNFATKQARAKARDYELGNTFRHTRSAGFSPRARSLLLVLGLQIFTKTIEILHERPAQADRARLIEQHKLTRRCAK